MKRGMGRQKPRLWGMGNKMEDHSQDVIDKTKLEGSEEQGKYEV